MNAVKISNEKTKTSLLTDAIKVSCLSEDSSPTSRGEDAIGSTPAAAAVLESPHLSCARYKQK